MSKLMTGALLAATLAGCTFNVVNPKVTGLVAEKGVNVSGQVNAVANVTTQTAAPATVLSTTAPAVATLDVPAPTATPVLATPAPAVPTVVPTPRQTPGPAKLILDGFEAHAISVYGGDGSTDAKVSVFQPGDRVAIRPLLKNVGGYPATAPQVVPTSDDARAEVSLCYGGEQAPLAYYDIPVGATQGPWHAGGGFCLDISKQWPHGKPISITLRVQDGNANTWGLTLEIPVL
jgi:hypothetical protein